MAFSVDTDHTPTGRTLPLPRLGPRGCGWLGFLGVFAFASLAAVQIMVLNPRAAAPGRNLAEIRDDVAAAGASLGHTFALIVLSIGVLLAIAGVVFAYAAPHVRRGAVTLYFLVLLVLGTPGYFFASYVAGSHLADTYGISGDDHSPWSLILYAVSALAVLGTLILIVRKIVLVAKQR